MRPAPIRPPAAWRIARALPGLALALLLPGCITVGPDFLAPSPQMPAGYRAPVPAPVGLLPPAADDVAWWKAFGDPVLDRLVAASLAGNPGLAEAASRVREAQATARGVAGRDAPSLDAGVDAGLREQRTIGPSRRSGAGGGGGSSTGTTSGSAGIGLSLGWEPDLFGGQRRAEEAARAEVVRQAWLRRQAALAVVGETARTYVMLRGVQNLQALVRESLDLQRQTLQLVEGRTLAGLAPQLDLARAESAVAQLEADLAPRESEIRRLANALAVLTGERPGALDELLLQEGEIPLLRAGPEIGLPIDLLRRRPDLQAAEAALARAVAEIGVAEAEFYPSLRLPGELSLATAGLGTGTVVNTALAALSAALNLPLLDGGQRSANLDAAQERAVQAAHAWRATLLNALQEVEAALLAYQGAQAQIAALQVTVEASERAFAQADALYRQGLASFLDVLDAQREQNASRRQLLAAQAELAQVTLDIYEAAGLAPELPPLPPRESLDEALGAGPGTM